MISKVARAAMLLLAAALTFTGCSEELDCFCPPECKSYNDCFNECALAPWRVDTLITWATNSLAHGIIEEYGNCVAAVRGGINNGSGGAQALYRPNWQGFDYRVSAMVKIALLEQHGIYIGGGVLGRYTPLVGDQGDDACPDIPDGGMGYALVLLKNIQEQQGEVILLKLNGLTEGPNYCYTVNLETLATQSIDLDTETWYMLGLELMESTIRVKVNSVAIFEIEDNDEPYVHGTAGLYYHGSRPGLDSEPPEIRYDCVSVREL